LFVGRLQARKRVDLLIRACAALETPIALTIVGDGPARADLEALAADLLPGTHFAGARHGAEAQPFFEAADLFALPGTGGLAVQQAMVYGLPVLAAEGDGTMADLVGPENGWRLPPGDLEALISALQNAAAGRDRLQRMGRASYELVQRKSNIEAMTDTFLRALAAVM
jgi:glycosyltransferase involved in cell wall biosynthesis